MNLIFAFILCILLFVVTPRTKFLIAVIASSLIMAIMAFFLTELNQYDLIAHRGLYETLQGGGISTVTTYSAIDGSPLFVWVVYLMTYLNDQRFVGAIPTFIGYFILFSLLVASGRKYDTGKSIIVIIVTILLFLLPWQDYSAGIRGAMAYSIATFGLYCDLRQKKMSVGVALYIAALFIHQAAIVFLLIRTLLIIAHKKPSWQTVINLLCLSLGSITEFMQPIIQDIASATGLSIIDTVSHSFESYAVKGKDIYEYSIVILRSVSIVMIYYIIKRSFVRHDEDDKALFNVYTMLMLISLGFIWQYDIICRYSFACIVLSSMLLPRCKKKDLVYLLLFSLFNLYRYYGSYYFKWDFLFNL